MQRISITNPQNIIDGTAKKYYFKLRNTGGPKGDKGEKGDPGSRGPQGEPGNAATVYVGSTTTLEVGQDATVENVGTQYNAVLNFGIPQGPRGPQGVKGDPGEPGQKGETGPRGPQGEKGTNATVYIGTTSTLNPGSQATVYNSGTDSNAVLNFGIPKGEKGDTGPMPTIAQTTGQSTTEVMSQKATTDALGAKQNTIDSSHKLSADLVDDTSTTNKFVTAQDKTNWNAKQDALTTGNNIDITGTTISTPAIAPEVVAELPSTGTEGKLYLTPKAHTTSTATGNPIEATITEQAGQLESFQLDGDTFQQTYTGKNLFNKYNPNMFVGYVGWNGGINSTSADRMIYIPCEPSTTYSIQKPIPTTNPKFRVAVSTDVPANGGTATVLTNDSYMSLGEATVTTRADSAYLMVYIWVNSSDMTLDEVLSGIQIEVGSSVSSYEPYVGGVPSPNPDYPQAIQTVTGLQTVEVVGKNLFDTTNADIREQYILNDSGVEVSDRSGGYTRNYSKVMPETTYILSGLDTIGGKTRRIYYYNKDKTFISRSAQITTGSPTLTFTTPANCYFVNIQIFYPNDTDTSAWQLELGSTASSYTPYSKQTLPISLGSIELCKLGTYQDYIYKDGDSWKVHKDIGKYQFDGAEPWIRSGSSTQDVFVAVIASALQDYLKVKDRTTLKSPSFSWNSSVSSASGQMDAYNGSLTAPIAFALSFDATSITNITDATTWISNNKPTVYSAINNPTDTTITDSTLIAQLEAIRTASLQNGTNTISNSATGSNLAGDMEIGYFEFNPTNRYDKWLWLDINNNYEQIGGE